MNDQMIDIIYRELRQRQTEDLLDIWLANDQEEYTEEAFEAIRRILAERIPGGPPAQPQSEPLQAALPTLAKRDYTAQAKQRRHEGARRKRELDEHIQARLERAGQLFLAGELLPALEAYDAILEKAPRNIEALLKRGMVCEDLDLPERAAHDYRRVLELDPGNAEAVRCLEEILTYNPEALPPELVEQLDGDAAPPPQPPTAFDDARATLRGWPGNRTRPERSGLDYVETQAELAHMQGLFVRKLFSGELFAERPLVFIFGALLALGGVFILLQFVISLVAWLAGF